MIKRSLDFVGPLTFVRGGSHNLLNEAPYIWLIIPFFSCFIHLFSVYLFYLHATLGGLILCFCLFLLLLLSSSSCFKWIFFPVFCNLPFSLSCTVFIIINLWFFYIYPKPKKKRKKIGSDQDFLGSGQVSNPNSPLASIHAWSRYLNEIIKSNSISYIYKLVSKVYNKILVHMSCVYIYIYLRTCLLRTSPELKSIQVCYQSLDCNQTVDTL